MRRGFSLLTLMLLVALAPRAAAASTYRWQADASGDWNVPGNWQVVEGAAGAGYPNLAGDVAVFDEPLTAARTVTIPDTVTVTIGRLTVALSPAPGRLSIAGAGTGRLVFDNLGEDALIESTGQGEQVSLGAPVELAADTIVNGSFQFASGISEAGGSRNVTITGGSIRYVAANSYTGTTTVTDGGLTLNVGLNPPVRTVGTLIIGDGIGAAGSATVDVAGDCIDHTADVLVRADGSLSFTRNAANTSVSATFDELTVEGGKVTVIGSLGAATLLASTLNMEGGEVLLPVSTNRLRVSGALNLTSTTAGAAVVRSTPSAIQFPGLLELTAGNHDVTVANGPQAVDFETVLTNIVQSDPGAGLTKRGPGVMRIGGDGSYTGPTAVLEGTLQVNGGIPSAVQVGAQGTLTGTGGVGAITVASGGTLAPGVPVGAMTSGSLTLVAGAHFNAEIHGALSPTGPGNSRLTVTGTVNLNGASLALTGDTALPRNGIFTIIENDGNDPVAGTFDGLPEGHMIVPVVGGAERYVISYQGGDGNDVVLVNQSLVEYFLSEGATGSFFDEDVMIANPNTADAPVLVRFLEQGGDVPVTRELVVPALSRVTLSLDQIPGLEDGSSSVEVFSNDRLPLAVERTMFWDASRYGGHTATAVTRTEREWLFGEGAQDTFFDTYLLLGNPQITQTDATVTFLRENDSPFVTTVSVPGRTRVTVHAGGYPELVGRSFGMKVESPVPIIAERAMYFASTPTRLWSGGHGNAGNPVASTNWFHAEGASGTFFNTFILISNPQTTQATVTLRFLLQSGLPIELTMTIAPQRRITINPGAVLIPALQNAAFSTVVTSDIPVVSERAMYWPTDVPFGEGHASSGVVSPALRWALAEGRVGGPNAFTTYILLANPNDAEAEVTVRFLRENGTPVVKNYTVLGNTRFNVDVGAMVPELQNESFGASIEVTNNVPIVVERSLYWNVNGIFWQGGSNAVGSVVP